MNENLHTRARKFLMELFNDEELSTLCFDYFPQVHNEFTTGMSKGQKVRMLVSYSQRHGQLDVLLAALERERPHAYPGHFPEEPHHITPTPAATQPVVRNPRQIFISHAHQFALTPEI